MPNYPTRALHVYRLNVDVDTQNKLTLNTLAAESEQNYSKASSALAGQKSNPVKSI